MCFFCLTEGVGKFGKQIKEFSTTKIFVTAPQDMAVTAPQKFWDHIWNLRFQASIILSHITLVELEDFAWPRCLLFWHTNPFPRRSTSRSNRRRSPSERRGRSRSRSQQRRGTWGVVDGGFWNKGISKLQPMLRSFTHYLVIQYCVCEKKHREPWQFMIIYEVIF